MRDAQQVSLILYRTTHIVLRIGRGEASAYRVGFVIVHIPEERLGFLAEVVVHASRDVVGVLWGTAARIRGSFKPNDTQNGEACRQGGVEEARRVRGVGSRTQLLVCRGGQVVGAHATAIRVEERLNIGSSGCEELRGWDCIGEAGRAAHAYELGAAKEEELVLENWAAHRTTELVTGVDALRGPQRVVGFRV